MGRIKLFEDFQLNEKESKETDRLQKLFDELVGPSGPADTKEGELVRAMMKIHYRYYNDGDYFYRGYGVETAGSCAAYLMHSKVPGLREAIEKAVGLGGDEKKEYKPEDAYDKQLNAVTKIICDYVEGKEGKYEKNDDDNLADKYDKDAESRWDKHDDANQARHDDDDSRNDDDEDDDSAHNGRR